MSVPRIRKKFDLLGVLTVLLLAVAMLAPGTRGDLPAWSEFCPVDGDPAVTDVLKPIRQKYRIPALGGAVVTSEGLDVYGVVGTRKRGSDVPATLHDKWHVGSCTKAMTAALVGRLVEAGLLKWDTTAADVFPDQASTFDADMGKVTVMQLLSHSGGVKRDLTLRALIGSQFLPGHTVSEQRLQVTLRTLAEKPKYPRGSTNEYSNLGYIIVGAMIEKVAGRSWEDAIQERLFKPLEMKSAGFGGTGTPGKLDQPWGHADDGRPADRNGPSADNHPVLGPAGRVHCTMRDWANFAVDQLRGSMGEPALLADSTYKILHAPPVGKGTALGWSVYPRDVLIHDGDNQRNFACIIIDRRKSFAILVCMNQSAHSSSFNGAGTPAYKAMDEAILALAGLHRDGHGRGKPIADVVQPPAGGDGKPAPQP